MKLITLNLWGGIVYEPLLEFIKKHAIDTDVFCFQEVTFGNVPDFTEVSKARINIFNEISVLLEKEFNVCSWFSPSDYFEYESVDFKIGQATFVRKNIQIKNNGGFCSYDSLPTNSFKGGKVTGNAQWVELKYNGEKFAIVNVHGLWQQGTSKVDTPERFIQSEKIRNFLSKKDGKKIICGDFNLAVNGRSLAILESGMQNLIKDYKIESTRSDFYKKPERLGDYILVSPDIIVKDFKVLQDQVSDHLPVYVEF